MLPIVEIDDTDCDDPPVNAVRAGGFDMMLNQ
jgi:hypothetical protein